jgi:hypothetical protein
MTKATDKNKYMEDSMVEFNHFKTVEYRTDCI